MQENQLKLARTMKLNKTYSGYLDQNNPYHPDPNPIKVGHPGDDVELINSWTDQGTTWHLVRVEGATGWLLDSETSTENFSHAN